MELSISKYRNKHGRIKQNVSLEGRKCVLLAGQLGFEENQSENRSRAAKLSSWFLSLGAGPSIPKEMLLVFITPSLVGTPSPQQLPVVGHCVLQYRLDHQKTPDDSL